MTEWMQNGWVTLGIAALALGVTAWLLGFLWERTLAPFILGEAGGELDRALARRAALPLQVILVAACTRSVLEDLVERRESFAHAVAVPYVAGVLLSLAVLAGAWLVSRVLEALAGWYLEHLSARAELRVDAQLMPFVRRAIRAVALFVALTVILGQYNVKLTALLGAAGVASLAVALAAQDTLANVIGGLTIMLDRPFRIGDRIELASGKTGDVLFIGLRSTRIVTPERATLIIPNAELVKQAVVNRRYPDPRATIREPLILKAGADVARAKAALAEALRGHPRVLAEPAPAVYVTGFAPAGVSLLLVYTIEREADRLAAADEVNTAVLTRLAAEGLPLG